ncbi:MAG: site-specific integrase [Leptospiraceae bacterium]|nr:site-specific integrase [Leptospiraceae bacterium]
MATNQLQLSGKKQYDTWLKKYNHEANLNVELTANEVLAFLERMKSDPRNYSLSALHLAKCAVKYSLKRMFLENKPEFEKFNSAIELFVVKIQRTKVRASDLLTEAEMSTLEKFLPIKKFLICLFFYVTGVRASEMCKIKLSDCVIRENENEVEIKINGKGRRKRFIYIPSSIYFTIVNKFQSVNYLFDTKIKSQFRGDSLNKYVSIHAKKILGRRVYPHLFRHTFITNQIKKHVSATAVAEYVGNSPTMIYQVYCHDLVDHKVILSNIDFLYRKVA